MYTADYTTYVQSMTQFFDSPSTLSPFSVHRMSFLERNWGRTWGSGPSTAAGAIKSSVQSFPEPLFGISVAVDGHIFQTDVCSASHPPTQSPRPPQAIEIRRVVLVGIRLGIAEVNPIYNETIKLEWRAGLLRHHITSLLLRRAIVSTWILIMMHARQSRCERLLNVSVGVGSRLGKPHLKGILCLPPAIVVPRHPPLPVVRARLPCYIPLPRHHPYQEK